MHRSIQDSGQLAYELTVPVLFALEFHSDNVSPTINFNQPLL